MLVSDLINRLGDLIDFVATFAPPDVRLAGMRIERPDGRFEISFDMGQNNPLAEKFKGLLADKLVEKNVEFRYYETGRRLMNRSPEGARPLDNMSSHIFETDKWVAKLVNFSNYAQRMAQTPAGEGETADDNNIEETGASDE
jgi:hypothetical protein